MTHYGKRKACDQSHLSQLSLTSITLGLLCYYRWNMYHRKNAHSKLVILSLGLKFAPGSPEKYLWKSTGLKCSEHTAEWFCRLPMRSFRLDKISPFFTSFTGLGAIIAEERNNMESYTFFKVRNIVAIKGNASSRHFTTPLHWKHQQRAKWISLFDVTTDFRPRLLWLGNAGKYCNFPALSGHIKICGILLRKKWRFCYANFLGL